MTVDGDRLSLTLDAQGLTYPVLVDPVISVPMCRELRAYQEEAAMEPLSPTSPVGGFPAS
ncbi:MAG: hypothetical protein IPJ34_18805 [Myxococcales bacterium]|nr:hypothetical protein [Myxococcales bacterium]